MFLFFTILLAFVAVRNSAGFEGNVRQGVKQLEPIAKGQKGLPSYTDAVLDSRSSRRRLPISPLPGPEVVWPVVKPISGPGFDICEPTSWGACDSHKDCCHEYLYNEHWCDNDSYNTERFNHSEMCCACGGGQKRTIERRLNDGLHPSERAIAANYELTNEYESEQGFCDSSCIVSIRKMKATEISECLIECDVEVKCSAVHWVTKKPEERPSEPCELLEISRCTTRTFTVDKNHPKFINDKWTCFQKKTDQDKKWKRANGKDLNGNDIKSNGQTSCGEYISITEIARSCAGIEGCVGFSMRNYVGGKIHPDAKGYNGKYPWCLKKASTSRLRSRSDHDYYSL